jgi:hypothetical protein
MLKCYICMYLLLCAMELYIILQISLSLQLWIMFYDSLWTLQCIIWYILLFSSYVEQFLLIGTHWWNVVHCYLIFIMVSIFLCSSVRFYIVGLQIIVLIW